MHRRKFVRGIAAGATFSIVPRHVLGGPKHVAPSDKIQLALIGAGGRGRQVLRGMLAEPDVHAVAVADPAQEYSLQNFYYKDVGGREPTRQLIEKHYQPHDPGFRCAMYADFREMLDREELDAIVCGTPDHLHAYVSATCLQAGKHVYCEKPLTHNIWEARTIAQSANRSGLATQMGNQGHSTDGIRQTVEWLQAGVIGDIEEVHAWVGASRWNPELQGKPSTKTDAPDGLNWDLWLGPRKETAFEPAYFPVAWRDFWAFGNANIGDFGCHDLDAACWALDLRHPSSIDFRPAGVCNTEIGPHGCIGYYQFPATAQRGAVTVTWYDGGLQPRRPGGWPAMEPLPGRGILFYGSEGVLFAGGAGGQPRLITQGPTPEVPATLRRVENHARDWLDAIHGGPAAGSHFGYGAQLTELALLGALSLRTGKSIDWDGPAMQARNLPEASSVVREDYRDGWQIETNAT